MRLKSLKNFKDEKKYLTYLLKDKINRQKKLINTITVLNQELEDFKEKNRLLEQELETYRNIEKIEKGTFSYTI
tara:strand:- start:172 stop:393 length:222 start_codon:yes stop_codon:yes gene_type:complete